MTSRGISSLKLAVPIALIINLVLFVLLPGLRGAPPVMQEAIQTRAISMVQLQEIKPSSPTEPEKTPELQDAPPKPRLELPIDATPMPSAQAPVFNAGPALPELDTRFFEPSPGDVVFGEAQLDKPVIPSRNPSPLYPFQARRMKLEGWVKVSFIVGRDGSVNDLEVVESSPPNIFDKSVLDTVNRWTFRPGEITGEPVRVRVTKVIRFNLNK